MTNLINFKQGMNSIRFKLLLSFIVVIAILIILNGIFLLLHFRIVQEYEKVTNNIILENQFIQLIPEFTQSYYNLVNSPKSMERSKIYFNLHNKINSTLFQLDTVIISSESKIKYKSLKNIVRNIMLKCDGGVESISRNDLISAISVYDYVLSKQSLITESTAQLLQEELKYTEELKKSIQQTHALVILFGIIFFAVISILCLLFAFFFSKKITTPLIRLAEISKKVSLGNDQNQAVDLKLVERGDEIGILSQAFNAMIFELQNKVEAITKKDDELYNVNRNLEEVNQKLAVLDKKKDEFISISSHELKTPVTIIKGFSQLLRAKKNLKKKELDYYLSLIDQNTVRLNNFIIELVDSSRLDLGEIKLKSEPVVINLIFNEIKEGMGQIIKNKKLKPVFKIEKNLPKVMGDGERVLQVIRNMITNAVKYTDKGTVSFSVYKKDDFVQFEVKDTGRGIPKDKQQFIFSKFYQVDGSFTREFGGSGLGLSICKGLVEKMNGKIWFDSVEGKGSSFYFAMPIAK
jgi:signal transduction histidine kinase